VRICVTGGAGYVGSKLVPALLDQGHEVVVYDNFWFYSPPPHPNLLASKHDIRNTESFYRVLRYKGIETVVHLACISNDTSCQLDEKLSTSINYDAFEPLVQTTKKAGVKRFIYCSSSSVYGVSNAPEVTEDHPLVPLTLYNKYKGLCEPILFRQMDDNFIVVVIRPATVCGPAPRMRFDLTVNIMTNHAVQRGEITVFGGSQKRPNLHIDDMVRCYQTLIEAPAERIQGQIFNVGYRNMTVLEIAKLVQSIIPSTINVKEHTDNRSYHINSDKIKRVLGFEPRFSVEDAVSGMLAEFRKGNWKDSLTNPIYLNIGQYLENSIA
jgi:nucleoside-diphosphate-sugar epimerase